MGVPKLILGNTRQGKFQLEVMQDVGHYLHEVELPLRILAGYSD